MEIALPTDCEGELALRDIDAVQKICASLLKSERYRKIGPEAIELIVCKARAIGMHPLEALNGGLICVKGKIEMSAQMMNALIRLKGHSITQVEYSDKKCVLKGTRKDNGDSFLAYFSMDDATRAGLSQNENWRKYPRSMLFARALSILARTLFPDIIRDCYVTGEIGTANDAPPQVLEEATCEEILTGSTPRIELVTEQEASKIEEALEGQPELREKIEVFLREKYQVNSFRELPRELADRILAKATQAAKAS